MTPVRCVPRPPPSSPDELLDRPVHMTVRDYPETLGVLRRSGVELGVSGGALLRSLEDAGTLAARLVEATAWRRGPAGEGER